MDLVAEGLCKCNGEWSLLQGGARAEAVEKVSTMYNQKVCIHCCVIYVLAGTDGALDQA